MKKKYLELALEIQRVDVQDVVTASPNGGLGIDWGATWSEGSDPQGN